MKGRGQKLLQGSNLDCSVSLANPRNSHDMPETCDNLCKKKPISTKFYDELYNAVSAWVLGLEAN